MSAMSAMSSVGPSPSTPSTTSSPAVYIRYEFNEGTKYFYFPNKDPKSLEAFAFALKNAQRHIVREVTPNTYERQIPAPSRASITRSERRSWDYTYGQQQDDAKKYGFKALRKALHQEWRSTRSSSAREKLAGSLQSAMENEDQNCRNFANYVPWWKRRLAGDPVANMVFFPFPPWPGQLDHESLNTRKVDQSERSLNTREVDQTLATTSSTLRAPTAPRQHLLSSRYASAIPSGRAASPRRLDKHDLFPTHSTPNHQRRPATSINEPVGHTSHPQISLPNTQSRPAASLDQSAAQNLQSKQSPHSSSGKSTISSESTFAQLNRASTQVVQNLDRRSSSQRASKPQETLSSTHPSFDASKKKDVPPQSADWVMVPRDFLNALLANQRDPVFNVTTLTNPMASEPTPVASPPPSIAQSPLPSVPNMESSQAFKSPTGPLGDTSASPPPSIAQSPLPSVPNMESSQAFKSPTGPLGEASASSNDASLSVATSSTVKPPMKTEPDTTKSD